MKIGFEAKRVFHNTSGLGNYSRNLIRALAQNQPNNQYVLYNPREGKTPFGQYLPNVTETNPSVSNALYQNLWRQKFLSERARKDGIDIFHGLSAELPAGLKKKGITSVVTVHDLIFIRYPQLYKYLDRKIYTRKLRSACNQANQIVAISQQTKSDLVEFLDIDPMRIRVIYQGTDPIYWKKYTEDELEEVRQRFELPERFGLFVGTLEIRKGADKILESQLDNGIPMVYVGRPTKFWNKLMQLGKYKKIRPLIHTPEVPENEDLAKLYRLADFFIYPSIFEGFGIPVLEALISKTPVITSDRSSLPEAAGPSARLIDPEDMNAINREMQLLWGDEKLRHEIAETGYTFAQHFTDEKIAGNWQHVYQNLMKR